MKATNLCAQGKNGTGTCQGDSGSSLQQYSPEHKVSQQYLKFYFEGQCNFEKHFYFESF